MSILDDIFDFFKDILDFIIENIWVILVIVIVVLAVFFPLILIAVWSWMTTVLVPMLGSWSGAILTFFADLGIGGAIAAGLGIGLLLEPEAAGEIIGETLGSLDKISGGLLTFGMWAVAGIVGYKILTSSSDETASASSASDSPLHNGDRLKSGLKGPDISDDRLNEFRPTGER